MVRRTPPGCAAQSLQPSARLRVRGRRHAARRRRRRNLASTAGARDAWQASLQSSKRDRPPPRSPIWDKSFRCVVNGKNASTNAYAVVLGPISEERKYSKWVYPILALKAALKKRGSRADVLALLALEEDKEHHRMLPQEEAMLRNAGCGIDTFQPRMRGFHMVARGVRPPILVSTLCMASEFRSLDLQLSRDVRAASG